MIVALLWNDLHNIYTNTCTSISNFLRASLRLFLFIHLDSFVGMVRVCLTRDQPPSATPVPPHSDHSYAPLSCPGRAMRRSKLGQNTGTAKIKTDNCGTMMKTSIPAISSTELVATTQWTKLLWFSQATYSNSNAAEPASPSTSKSHGFCQKWLYLW